MTMQLYWNFPRSISAIRVLLTVGQLHGLTHETCLENTHISLSDLSQSNFEVEAEQEFIVIRNLLKLLGPNLPIGLEAGLRHHTTTFGAWGFAILSSQTMKEALHFAMRYFQLSSIFCNLEVVHDGTHTLLIFDHSQLPDDLEYFLVERDLITVISIQRDVLPIQFPVMSINVALPAPKYVDKFLELTGYSIHFNQPQSCIIFESHLLDLPLPQADPFIRARYEAECQQLWTRRSSLGSYSQKVRNILLLQPSQMPKIDEMADYLQINLRTLQRHLAVEGITYERLIDDIRKDLAEDLLKTTSLTVEEVANQLGYSEVSAFSRAFKRWKSISPKNFRLQK
ncbi:AraC family transcriptional regulator [Acinetobacter halotolerans]|uniref:AraC family transcriptional regulator n=1 Tax=Acinetobacter halotolerans TaxID=1752076 RepID=A0A4Q6XIZ7_9GAMM|nr:AraC family transcriptional regulator [Acinetobacter halotolerans]RZF55893.1 AraC family transcriptional regulator [Acinetobacter halotolerans]